MTSPPVNIMKGLFELHKKDTLPAEQTEFMDEMTQLLRIYMADRSEVGDTRAKANLLLRQIEEIL